MQQHQQNTLIHNQELKPHELNRITSLPQKFDHNHHQHQDSLATNFGKQEHFMKYHHSSPSYRNISVDSRSSSGSDTSEDHSAFFRAAVHTTRRTDQEQSSSASLCSASASSLAPSVASSQDFQGLTTSSEIPSPAHSLVLESGIHQRLALQRFHCVVPPTMTNIQAKI